MEPDILRTLLKLDKIEAWGCEDCENVSVYEPTTMFVCPECGDDSTGDCLSEFDENPDNENYACAPGCSEWKELKSGKLKLIKLVMLKPQKVVCDGCDEPNIYPLVRMEVL